MVVLSLFLCTLPPARMFRWCREIESCVYPPGRTPSRLGDSDNCTSMDMTGSDQGAYNSYVAVHTFWADTTNMDNIRGADITDGSVAGSTETISDNVCHTDSSVEAP